MQRFIRKSFAVSKNIHTFAVIVSTMLPICTANQSGTFAFYNSTNRIFKDGTWWDFTYAPLAFDYKSQKLQEKFGCFEYSAYLCYNKKRKESYMETKDKKNTSSYYRLQRHRQVFPCSQRDYNVSTSERIHSTTHYHLQG